MEVKYYSPNFFIYEYHPPTRFQFRLIHTPLHGRSAPDFSPTKPKQPHPPSSQPAKLHVPLCLQCKLYPPPPSSARLQSMLPPITHEHWLHSFNLQAHYTKTTTHNHHDQTPISSMDPDDLNSSDELVCTPKHYLPYLTQSHSQLHARTPTSHTIQPTGTCHQLTTNSSQIELNQPASKSPTLEFSLCKSANDWCSQNPTPNLLDRHRLTSRRQALPPWSHHRSDYNPPTTPNHQDTHLLLLP